MERRAGLVAKSVAVHNWYNEDRMQSCRGVCWCWDGVLEYCIQVLLSIWNLNVAHLQLALHNPAGHMAENMTVHLPCPEAGQLERLHQLVNTARDWVQSLIQDQVAYFGKTAIRLHHSSFLKPLPA